jgi:hypothetical protein
VAKQASTLNWANIYTYILVLIVNGLAGSTTLIGGKNTAEISDKFFTLVTPAGYVFAIWGIIYLLLGVFVVYQFLPNNRTKVFQRDVWWLFVISGILNVLWIFAWQYEQLIISVIIMIALLAVLIILYLSLDIGRSRAPLKEKLAVHLPFSVYLGWITIATIANISAMLVSLGWDGFGISPESWAILIIIVADVIAILVALTRRDVAYELVFIWAFVGIAANQSAHQTLVIVTLASAVMVAIVTAVVIAYRKLTG